METGAPVPVGEEAREGADDTWERVGTWDCGARGGVERGERAELCCDRVEVEALERAGDTCVAARRDARAARVAWFFFFFFFLSDAGGGGVVAWDDTPPSCRRRTWGGDAGRGAGCWAWARAWARKIARAARDGVPCEDSLWDRRVGTVGGDLCVPSCFIRRRNRGFTLPRPSETNAVWSNSGMDRVRGAADAATGDAHAQISGGCPSKCSGPDRTGSWRTPQRHDVCIPGRYADDSCEAQRLA